MVSEVPRVPEVSAVSEVPRVSEVPAVSEVPECLPMIQNNKVRQPSTSNSSQWY